MKNTQSPTGAHNTFMRLAHTNNDMMRHICVSNKFHIHMRSSPPKQVWECQFLAGKISSSCTLCTVHAHTNPTNILRKKKNSSRFVVPYSHERITHTIYIYIYISIDLACCTNTYAGTHSHTHTHTQTNVWALSVYYWVLCVVCEQQHPPKYPSVHRRHTKNERNKCRKCVCVCVSESSVWK